MRIPRFAVVLLPTLAFTLAQTSPAQETALLEAPAPMIASSSSALPSAPAFMGEGVYPVQRAPQPVEIKKPKLNVMDWSLLGAASMLRVLDYTSTEKAMADPSHFREAMLPTALVENKPAFAAFQAATVGANYFAYRLLVRHHMRGLAQAAQYVYVSGMTFQVARNYQTLGSIPSTSAAH